MFCFFKQKTAYEMRISDWSSDVCSSDLVQHVYAHRPAANADQFAGPCIAACRAASGRWQGVILCLEGRRQSRVFRNVGTARSGSTALSTEKIRSQRSEEHTSELQSLMRISYAVFCLKKTTTKRKPLAIITNKHMCIPPCHSNQ